jgi:hypothetical protein
MWSNHKTYKRNDGSKRKYIVMNYKCSSNLTRGIKKCDGQSTYSMKKIDKIVENKTLEFIENLSKNQIKESLGEDIKNSIEEFTENYKIKEKELREIQDEILELKKDIGKSLVGKSKFTPELLQEAIKVSENNYKIISKEIDSIKNEIDIQKAFLKESVNFKESLHSWIDDYRKNNIIERKAMINNVIEKVILHKTNGVTIYFKILSKTYNKNMVVKCNV